MTIREPNPAAPSPWPQISGGLHMRADASDAGRLARLADVVLWLIETQGLPRVPAVHRVADQLEAANPTPELFAAQPDNYARPIEGDAARFGYHTAETYARASEQARVDYLEKLRNPPQGFSSYSGRALGLPPIGGSTLRPRMETISTPVEPGRPALLRLLRERWTWARMLAVSPPVTNDAEAFAHARLPGRTVALRLTDAARIWGYGADWLPVTVTEPTTFAELVAAVKGRSPGTRWSHAEKALLFQEFERRGGWIRKGNTWGKDTRVQDRLASELGLTRNALDRHLAAIRRETDTAPVARVHRMQR